MSCHFVVIFSSFFIKDMGRLQAAYRGRSDGKGPSPADFRNILSGLPSVSVCFFT